MAFVRSIHDDGVNDPYYKVDGVVTLEDVIEMLIHAEIYDESDLQRSLLREKTILE